MQNTSFPFALLYAVISFIRLSVNVRKTKAVMFWKSKGVTVPLSNIYLNGQVIEFVKEYTYLGFVLDDRLSFHNHAKNLYRPVNPRFILYRRYRNSLVVIQLLPFLRHLSFRSWNMGTFFVVN